jgi:hypothetical protein
VKSVPIRDRLRVEAVRVGTRTRAVGRRRAPTGADGRRRAPTTQGHHLARGRQHEQAFGVVEGTCIGNVYVELAVDGEKNQRRQ